MSKNQNNEEKSNDAEPLTGQGNSGGDIPNQDVIGINNLVSKMKLVHFF